MNPFEKLYTDFEQTPICYDIKDEYKELLQISDKDTNIEKWKKYKAYQVDQYSVYGIDCDVSFLAISIYHKAWDFLKGVGRPTKQYGAVKLSQLTGCSIHNGGGEIIPISSIFSREKIQISYAREYKYQLILHENNKKYYYRGDTMTSFQNIYRFYEKWFVDNEEIGAEIEKLAKNHHTIGNMLPVPTGFNTNRAGAYAVTDFWDLTLMQIKEWYENKDEDKPLYVLFHNNQNAVEYCKKWLDIFGTWNGFIEGNYLQSFVEKEDDQYQLVMFWEEHGYENTALPKEENSFLSFLRYLNGAIVKRNGDIVKVVV